MTLKLRANEKKVITANIHWSSYIPRSILALASIPLMVSSFIGNGETLIINLIFSFLMIFPLLKLFLFNKTKTYTMTSERFYCEEGILSKKKTSIPLNKINDAQLSQSMIQRMFNSGTISILTGNDKKTKLKDIDKANEFLENIESYIRPSS